MDPERWPDYIRNFVEAVVCPRCGTAKCDGVMVTVRYQAPAWMVFSNCMRCKTVHWWQHIAASGTMQPKPAPKPAEPSTPVPEWVKNL